MIFAIMILFVTSLLVTAVFVSARGDIKLTQTSSIQKEAYNAAVAGISRYKYQLNSEDEYWKKCPSFSSKIAAASSKEAYGSSEESFEVKTLPSSKHTEKECKEEKQTAIVESAKSANGTFRIESTGEAAGVKRSIIATFTHPGFLNYVYFTKYEVEDPTNFTNPVPTNECENYYKVRKATYYEQDGKKQLLTKWCPPIHFAANDKVNGPMHTDDSAAICGSNSAPTFGRTKTDKIEMNGGNYLAEGCSSDPYSGGEKSANEASGMLGTYTEKGEELSPPSTDNELLSSAEDKFEGETFIELSGNKMKVTHASTGQSEELPFPSDGVVYVENTTGGCGTTYTPFATDYAAEKGCGNVYVKGSYTESLTIGAEGDVVIDGNIETSHESSGEPTGAATLGLIATNFVRVYHPVTKEYKVAESTAETTPPTIVYKEETPRTREKLLEQNPTLTEETLEQAPTIKEKTLEEAPTIKEKTVEEAGTGSKKETCKSGFTYSRSTKMCVGKVVEESCPTGYTLTNKKCTKKVSEETCNEGYTLTSKKCVKKVTVEKCSSGYTLTNKKCTEKVTEEYCNTGYTLTNKKCVATTGEETCGNGSKLNGKKQCVASCPYGQSYEEAEGLCVGKCEGKDKSLGKGICEYLNNSEECDADNETGSLSNPTIDAAILSTDHSFIVDNYICGSSLGNLNIWGSIAQYWRGPVGTGSGSSTSGYTKNYNYDERLATYQPPNFLAPTTNEWKISRETAPPNGFEG